MREFEGGCFGGVRGCSGGSWRSVWKCFRVVGKDKTTDTYNQEILKMIRFPTGGYQNEKLDQKRKGLTFLRVFERELNEHIRNNYGNTRK